MDNTNTRKLNKWLAILAIFLILAEHLYGSKSYEVEDPSKPITFVYNKLPNPILGYAVIRIRTEGAVEQGSALIKVYGRNFKTDTAGYLVLEQRLKGNFDIKSSYDYYDNRVYIYYKPRKVVKGKVRVTVSIT